jgi:hypothetical protein
LFVPQDDLERVLALVDQERRELLKRLFVGAAAAGVALAAVPLMTTQSLAQKEGEDPGPDGKCDEGLVVSKKTGKCAVPKGGIRLSSPISGSLPTAEASVRVGEQRVWANIDQRMTRSLIAILPIRRAK